jgi:hypothetical protein
MSLARAALLLSILAIAGCGSSSAHEEARQPTILTQTSPAASPSAFQIPSGSGHLAAMAGRRGLTLRDRPRGRVIAHLPRRTEWGSPTIVWAADRRGHWLGVYATALPNNRIGWLDARHDRPRMWLSQYTLRADLSDRTLVLRKGARVVRRMQITVGNPSTPTPTGRFAVTDKLIPGRGLSYYGCCLLALSGHQSRLRPGWAGGDRIAIHGSPSNLVGAAASAGCLRARDSDLRALMKVVPIGTPVIIRA